MSSVRSTNTWNKPERTMFVDDPGRSASPRRLDQSKPLPTAMQAARYTTGQNIESVEYHDNPELQDHVYVEGSQHVPGHVCNNASDAQYAQREGPGAALVRPQVAVRNTSYQQPLIREEDRAAAQLVSHTEGDFARHRERSGSLSTRTMRSDDKRREAKSKGFFGQFGSMVKNSFEPGYPYDVRSEEQHRSQPSHMPGEYHDAKSHKTPREQLYREIDQLRAENVSLQDSLRQANGTVDKFIRSADRMQKTMDSKEFFLGGQALDDEVRSKYQSFLSQVRTWSSKLELGPALTRTNISEDTAAEFELVAPGCLAKDTTWWKSAKRIRKLVRGWLGYVLVNSMFRAHSGIPTESNNTEDHWLGEIVRGSVSAIEDRMVYALNSAEPKLSMRNLHDWRALTIELLSRIDLGSGVAKELTSFIDTKTKDIVRVVKDFIPTEKHDSMLRDLSKLVRDSIQLSQFLRRQRAFWWAVGPIPEQSVNDLKPRLQTRRKFDAKWMEDDEADEYENGKPHEGQRLVELYIAPGLLKRGNVEGDGYDCLTCIVPILVNCR